MDDYTMEFLFILFYIYISIEIYEIDCPSTAYISIDKHARQVEVFDIVLIWAGVVYGFPSIWLLTTSNFWNIL